VLVAAFGDEVNLVDMDRVHLVGLVDERPLFDRPPVFVEDDRSMRAATAGIER
jgi:hypothetical protein